LQVSWRVLSGDDRGDRAGGELQGGVDQLIGAGHLGLQVDDQFVGTEVSGVRDVVGDLSPRPGERRSRRSERGVAEGGCGANDQLERVGVAAGGSGAVTDGGPAGGDGVERQTGRQPSVGAASDAVEPGRGVGGEQDRRAGMLGRANGQRGGLDAFLAGDALGSAAPERVEQLEDLRRVVGLAAASVRRRPRTRRVTIRRRARPSVVRC